MKRQRKTFERTTLLGILAVFVFTGVFGLRLLSRPVQAQFFDPANTAANVTSAGEEAVQTSVKVKESTWDIISRTLVNTATLAVLNAANYFAQKIAYDAANYFASGSKGQKPFFTTEAIGDYLGNVGKDAAGEALGTITEEGGLEALGINLCAPSSPRVALNIKLGFLNGLPGLLGGPPSRGAPQPKCEWRNISDNWSEFSNLDSDTVLSQVGVMFTPGQNSLSGALEFNNYSRQLISRKQEEAVNDYLAKGGIKDLVSKVSGKVLTPAETIKSEMERSNKEAAESGKKTSETFSASAIGEGAFGILPAALQTFVGTLGEKLMKRAFERGLIALSSGGESSSEDPFDFDSGSFGGGRAAAELANASLLTPKIFSSTNYDELTLFATCPPEGAQPDNCVMDTDFFNGVQRSQQGEPITVRQALEQGFLHGERRLLPLGHPDNASENCYQNAYCFSNLIKLRRARIIPIGWELAANSPYNDTADPITLKEVVDNFNNCPVTETGEVDASKLPDPLHPWCRLIDPNWIIKYPEAICTQQAPGPSLLTPLGDVRGQVCVDSQSCILEDENGKCIGGYGYCVAEKSFWRLGADSCPAQFATCQSVRRTDNGELSSFLMNTTEVDVCNQENAGCRQYSRSGNLISNGGFEDVLGGRAQSWGSGAIVRSGRDSQNGENALALASGASDTQFIPSVLSGRPYELTVSALAPDTASDGAALRMKVRFFDALKGVVVPDSGELETDCQLADGGSAALAEVVMSELGYLSAKCTVTSPEGAVSAEVSLSASGGRAYVDDASMLGPAFSFNPLDTMYLNGKVETCSSNQAGCREFISASTAKLNLVRNPGFEKETAAGDMPTSWNLPNPSAYAVDGAFGLDGVSVVMLSPAAITQETGGLLPEATYTFSVSSRYAGSGTPDAARAVLTIVDSSGNEVAPFSLGEGCELFTSDPARPLTDILVPLPTADEYTRTECQFTTPSDAKSVRIALSSDSVTDDIFADQAQLELGTSASDFHEGYASTAQSVHLKAAPPGLNCTGSSSDPDICAQFALSCRREEVGCNLYSPEDGGTAIPAITNAGDACPSECVGYETFRQEPTDFAREDFPVFFIPATANACSASEAGCEEFTNLSAAATGGESREYYSSLRLCTPPDVQTETFYTWEGSDTEGFKLKVWQFRKSNVESSATGDTGSDPTGGFAPCTNLEYNPLGTPQCADSISEDNIRSCSKMISAFDPDCREFYDVDGNIHYRYFSKTIVASNNCTEYRMTRIDQDDCQTHGGFWTGQECRYFAVGELSSSCRAEAAGCRAYTGNASRNVRNILNDGFESGTTDAWGAFPGADPTTDVINSNASVSAGGHSLKVTSPQVMKDVSSDISEGGTYLLSFWARGSGDLRVRFTGAGDEDFTFSRTGGGDAPIGVTTEWRSYRIGPVRVVNPPAVGADAADREHLIFVYDASGPAPLYLDNITLREVAEAEYVVMDSWKTPASCDQTPFGDPAPQYMLGCQSYRDTEGATANLKSFSRLCREEAVGCRALYDTQNSESPFFEAYNAVCSLETSCVPDSGVTCDCDFGGESVCQVPQGGTSCKFDAKDPIDERLVSDGGNISPDGDTVRIPADRLRYLIDTPEKRCDAKAKGCSVFGLPEFNQDGDIITKWETSYLLDSPKNYTDQLCRSEENFCQAYTRTFDNSPVYFKDPLNHRCEFKTSVTINGFSFSGWFKKGLTEPCYDDFLEGGNAYGIWKNSDSAYDGWVGECQPNFDQCKEFIDPLDTSEAHPEGEPYYAILNDQLDTSTCQNRVSLTTAPSAAKGASACVLFDQTDILTKTFDASDSYDASDAQNGALVSAKSSAVNDTNVVIRVDRDRRCSEWLDCRSSETVFNASTGDFQNVCTGFAICGAFEQQGDSTQCSEYVDSLYKGRVLTDDLYQARSVGQSGIDLSGFSIPDRYPVNELVTVNISPSVDSPDFRLVYSIGESACLDEGKSYLDPCGEPNNLGNRGVCLGQSDKLQCVYAIDGNPGITADNNPDLSVWERRYPSKSCRAYPEENAPFPSKVAGLSGWDESVSTLNNGNPVLTGLSPSFRGANVCQRRYDANGEKYESCECSYQAAQYGNSGNRKYFSIEDSNLPNGYCVGGSYDGFECTPRASGVRSAENPSCCSEVVGGDFGAARCKSGAQCAPLAKVDRVIGYEGQCLENDLRNPINGTFNEFACATWRPVGIVGGSLDIYNLNQSAGYFVKPDRRFYCSGFEPEWLRKIRINPDKGIEQQDITKFFGPGKVSAAVDGYVSDGGNCSNDADSQGTVAFCIYPSKSKEILKNPELVDDGTGGQKVRECKKSAGDCGSGYSCFTSSPDDPDGTPGKCYAYRGFGTTGDALSILGCYEVSDDDGEGVISTPATIEWPYIGPRLNKVQLKHIYFQVTDDIYHYDPDRAGGSVYYNDSLDSDIFSTPYDDLSHASKTPRYKYIVPKNEKDNKPDFARIPTNPGQDVFGDCNDEGSDNIDNEEDDKNDSKRIGDSLLLGSPRESASDANNGVFFLTEKNDWEVEASDNEGLIRLKADFDSGGWLKGIRLAARDNSDEGTFGIIEMGFGFYEGCSQISQVDEPNGFGLTKAFTDRLNGYAAYEAVNNGAEQTDKCRPWGAVGGAFRSPFDPVSGKLWPFVSNILALKDEGIDSADNLQCLTGSNFFGVAYDNAASAVVDASENLRELFRKTYHTWEFMKDSFGTGIHYNDTIGDTYDDTDDIGSSINPFPSASESSGPSFTIPAAGYLFPVIATVSTENCTSDGTCPVGTLGSMTINGKERGIITVQNGVLKAVSRFYGWASHNAMPILSRRVIWGDLATRESASRGWYKNQKPYCSSGVRPEDGVGECAGVAGLTCIQDSDCPGSVEGSCGTDEPNHFGNTPGSCAEAPFQFQHVYTCTAKDLGRLSVCEDDEDGFTSNAPCKRSIDPDADGPAGVSEACVYRPGAQIKDNWDWCNCTGSDCTSFGGAFGENCDPATALSERKPWTEFQGELRVFPDPDEVANPRRSKFFGGPVKGLLK